MLFKNEVSTMKRVVTSMLRSKTGLTITAFRDWQALPERKDLGLNVRASQFEKGLLRFVHHNIRVVHNELKAEADEGTMKKRSCCIRLINTTMTGTRKYVNRWKDDLKKSAIALQTFGCLQMFELVNKSVSTHLDGVLLNDPEFGQERQDLCDGLEELEEALYDGDSEHLKEGLSEFAGDSELQRLSRTYLTKLMQSKMGRVIFGFHEWKTLPELKDRALAARTNKF
jgi:hypothetical protein